MTYQFDSVQRVTQISEKEFRDKHLNAGKPVLILVSWKEFTYYISEKEITQLLL
jgi:hypothetical protein